MSDEPHIRVLRQPVRLAERPASPLSKYGRLRRQAMLLVLTRTDADVAAELGISPSTVGIWRKADKVESYAARCRRQRLELLTAAEPSMGITADWQIAEVLGLPERVVTEHRRTVGIPALKNNTKRGE